MSLIDNRHQIGFAVSMAAIFIGKGIPMAEGEELASSMQDIGFHTVGVAMGSFVTDRYLLSPVVHKDTKGNPFVGVVLHSAF